MLEELIDFLSTNIVLIIAVVGGIVAFISDKKKKEEQESQNPKQPVQRQQRTGRPIANPEMRRFEQSEQRGAHESPNREKIRRDIDDTVAETVDETKKLLEKARNAGKSSSSQRGYASNRSSKKSFGSSLNRRNRLNRKNLEEAIIMSEILGPPRAFKPHSRDGISTYRK